MDRPTGAKEDLSVADPSVKKNRELGDASIERLMSEISVSLSLPLMPALLLMMNLEGKEIESGVVEGGKGQIEVFVKKVECSEYIDVRGRKTWLGKEFRMAPGQ